MKDLRTITALVEDILIHCPDCRNSDNILYLTVAEAVGIQAGLYVDQMTVRNFLVNMKKIGVPPFESVRRARQKLQAKRPELRACEAVQEARAENEAVYREYARS